MQSHTISTLLIGESAFLPLVQPRAAPKELTMSSSLRSSVGATLLPFFAVCVGLFFFAFTSSAAEPSGLIHEAVEYVGIVLIVVCIVGRNWTSMFHPPSGLSAGGPYSVCRQPMYAFAVIGVAGIGAQVGSVSVSFITAASAYVAFFCIIRQTDASGDDESGSSELPALWPRLDRWKQNGELKPAPPSLRAMTFDALAFFLPLPAAEFFESMQSVGIIPVLFVLP